MKFVRMEPEAVVTYGEPGDSRTEFAKLQVRLHVGILSKVGGSESEVVAFSLRLGHAHEKNNTQLFFNTFAPLRYLRRA